MQGGGCTGRVRHDPSRVASLTLHTTRTQALENVTIAVFLSLYFNQVQKGVLFMLLACTLKLPQ